jgi:tRNA 2-thiocytidine biosynthesis protein TtcA
MNAAAPAHPVQPTSPRSEAAMLRRKLGRKMGTTMRDYGLLQDGDKVMVCVSGGKDSYSLLDLMWEHKQRAPVKYDLVAVHLDQGQPGYDGAPLRTWLERFGAPFEILHKDTYSIVMSLVKEGDTYCAPCSRLRRGTLYGAAERLGCNKIALGHHRDDALETFLMNLFFAGKLQAMPATYTTDDGKYQVIRPLIECAEVDIAEHARLAAYPILPCNLCGSQDGLKREAMTQLMNTLSKDIPDVRNVMLAALQNVRPSHLLDAGLIRRLGGLPEGAEDAGSLLRTARPNALPVLS